jgi:hypothetical protein
MSESRISPELMLRIRQDQQAVADELPDLKTRDARMFDAAAEDTLCGHLRRAVLASPRPIRDIAKDSGIDSELLCDFLEGTRTLQSDVLDRLMQAAGIAVTFGR